LPAAPTSTDAPAVARLQALVQALPDLILLFDEDGRCLDVLPQQGPGDGGGSLLPVAAIKDRLITPPDESDPQPCSLLPSIQAALAANAVQVAECSLAPPPDDRVFEARVIPIGLKPDGRRTVVVLARDVTASVQSRRRLEHAANRDALTGLPNRRLLDERLAGLAERAGQTGTYGAVLLLDLDRFKRINDRFGHALGDRLLQAVADRLQTVIRRQDLVARFGGDEFVLVLEGLPTQQDATLIAEQIRNAFATPFVLPATEPEAVVEVKITASIGVAVFPDDGDTAESLLRQADAAMYAGKGP
jgi:diguanylate cyclase (GGDEF)-like protein